MTRHGAFRDRVVLVTGHTGFKGSWLCHCLLRAGARVVGLSLPPESRPNLFSELELAPRLTAHQEGDVRDADLMRRLVRHWQPEIVFHLAAQPIVRLARREPRETIETNVLGTLNVLEALRMLDHPCSAIFVTTDKVYAQHAPAGGCREDDALGGEEPYSASKACAEFIVRAYRRSILGDRGMAILTATARAGNVIGGGDWAMDRIVPDAARALASRRQIQVRSPSSVRAWIHVLDVLRGYLDLAAALDRARRESAVGLIESLEAPFNFGCDLEQARPVRDLVEEFLRHWTGSWVPASSAESARGGESPALTLDSTRAQERLGWAPRWNFEEACARTAQWYRRFYDGTLSAKALVNEDIDAHGVFDAGAEGIDHVARSI